MPLNNDNLVQISSVTEEIHWLSIIWYKKNLCHRNINVHLPNHWSIKNLSIPTDNWVKIALILKELQNDVQMFSIIACDEETEHFIEDKTRHWSQD